MEIGKVIRAFRNQRKLTLKDLAEMANISPSYLSQIENDLVNMNMSVLENISKSLNTPIYMFFLQESIDRISYVRKEDRSKLFRKDQAVVERLTNPDKTTMDIQIMTFPANYHSAEYASHQGEEFLLVLEGALTVDFSGYKILSLEGGDSLAYSSKIPHLLQSEHGCKVLMHSATPPIPLI